MSYFCVFSILYRLFSVYFSQIYLTVSLVLPNFYFVLDYLYRLIFLMTFFCVFYSFSQGISRVYHSFCVYVWFFVDIFGHVFAYISSCSCINILYMFQHRPINNHILDCKSFCVRCRNMQICHADALGPSIYH